MNKRGRIALIISIILIIILIIISFLYVSLFKPNTSTTSQKGTSPLQGLTDQQAEAQFNESFILYLLYNIKAYQLHNPPLSSETPKIEIILEDASFNAIIEKENIIVSEGSIENEDIQIITTKKEAILMIKDANYIKDSFISGKSSINLLADKTTLFTKGYLNIYNELNPSSVTGNVIKIYSE
jgi:hypothetical protein